jgi:hypothetical protein
MGKSIAGSHSWIADNRCDGGEGDPRIGDGRVSHCRAVEDIPSLRPLSERSVSLPLQLAEFPAHDCHRSPTFSVITLAAKGLT